MKNKDMEMKDRMIKILNNIINKLEGYYSGTDVINYCKNVKSKLEKEDV